MKESRMLNAEEKQELLLWIKWMKEINYYNKRSA